MKKLISVLLCSIMTLSIAGCSLSIGTPKEVKNFLGAMDDLGFVEFEKKSDVKKHGAYQLTSKAGEIDQVLDNYDDVFNDRNFPMVDSDELQCIAHAQKYSDNYNTAIAIMFVFEDEDDAEDYMDEFQDYFEEVNDSMHSYAVYNDFTWVCEPDKDSIYVAYSISTGTGETNSCAAAVVLEDNVVYLVYAIDDDGDEYCELADEMCDALGFDEPYGKLN